MTIVFELIKGPPEVFTGLEVPSQIFESEFSLVVQFRLAEFEVICDTDMPEIIGAVISGIGVGLGVGVGVGVGEDKGMVLGQGPTVSP